MKKSFLAGAFLAATAVSGAMAADLPARSEPYAPAPMAAPVQGYNWTGFYAGLNAGYGWGNFRSGLAPILGKPRGAVLGGQIGYNYQINNFVIGAEGDLSWSGMTQRRVFAGPVTTKGSVDWAGSLRARAGFAADRALVYATGGYAFGKVSAQVIDTVIPVSYTSGTTRHGWVLGGGIEYAFTNNISGKAEYLYSRYASKTIFGLPYTTASGVSTSVVRAGVNYHF